MATIPPPDFSNDDGGESSTKPRSGPGFAPPRGPNGGVKRDFRGAAKYDFSRALKFITENNPQLDDELQVMRVFSGGGAVELIYNLPPWTYVEVCSFYRVFCLTPKFFSNTIALLIQCTVQLSHYDHDQYYDTHPFSMRRRMRPTELSSYSINNVLFAIF